MKRLLLLAVCLSASARSATDDLAPVVRRLMARDQIPGVALGIVEHGRLIYVRGFGWRDVEKQEPVTPDTLFPLGSCSKTFTATAVAMLADEGKLGLDDPVRTWLPDFTLADPAASASVTIRDLLTHRSGLPRHDLFWYQAPFSRDELYRRLRFLELAGPPHAEWRYNSLMFVVAARIVEKIAGGSWEAFVRRRILSPLGMRRTLLSAEMMEADPDHASPYAVRDGRLTRIPLLKGSPAIAPAGGVQSSVRDLARWLTFHANRSPPLIGEEMWRELHRPQVEMPAQDQPEVQHTAYALAWIHESYRGHPVVVHDGAIDGFTAHLAFLPETGQSVIILMNRWRATAAINAIAYTAYDRLLGLPPIDWASRLKETPPPSPELHEVPLDVPIGQLAGRYEHPGYGTIILRAHGDRLELQFREIRTTLAYQGHRRFLSREPLGDGIPPISVRFSDDKPVKMLVQLNFEEGDPLETFKRVGAAE
jgi:CubicO group peptidase (beta-lactamase class C family)